MMRKITSVTREYHCLMSSKFRTIAQEYGNWSPLERQHGHQHPLEGREHISRSSPIFRFVSSITSIRLLSNSSGLEPRNSTLDKNLLLQCNPPIKKKKSKEPLPLAKASIIKRSLTPQSLNTALPAKNLEGKTQASMTSVREYGRLPLIKGNKWPNTQIRVIWFHNDGERVVGGERRPFCYEL